MDRQHTQIHIKEVSNRKKMRQSADRQQINRQTHRQTEQPDTDTTKLPDAAKQTGLANKPTCTLNSHKDR
jgi:hypothetical protein